MKWGLFQISLSQGIHHTFSMAALLSQTAARRDQPAQRPGETTVPRVGARPPEGPIGDEERFGEEA